MNKIELTESELIIHLMVFAKPVAFLSRVPRRFPLADVAGAALDPTVIGRLDLNWDGPPLPGWPSGDPDPNPLAPDVRSKHMMKGIETSPDVGRFRVPTGGWGFYAYTNPERVITITIRSGPAHDVRARCKIPREQWNRLREPLLVSILTEV